MRRIFIYNFFIHTLPKVCLLTFADIVEVGVFEGDVGVVFLGDLTGAGAGETDKDFAGVGALTGFLGEGWNLVIFLLCFGKLGDS